jgi:hypothetical protein
VAWSCLALSSHPPAFGQSLSLAIKQGIRGYSQGLEADPDGLVVNLHQQFIWEVLSSVNVHRASQAD